MLAVDADDGTDRALLLDRDLGDDALATAELLRALVLVLDLGLADQHQPAVLGDLGELRFTDLTRAQLALADFAVMTPVEMSMVPPLLSTVTFLSVARRRRA